ncbi:Adenylate cyclase type 10, partial [Blyttiomyces sp. JEL0837]
MAAYSAEEQSRNPPTTNLAEVVNIESRFVAGYVRDLIADGERFAKMLAELERGRAYVEEEYLAVVMIDISGYSKVTSTLTALGKISSEIVTNTVSSFMSKTLSKHGSFLVQWDTASLAEQAGVSRETVACATSGASGSDPLMGARLRLHVAITAGRVRRMVMGNPSTRLDYSVGGECLSSLATILDGTSPGEMGIQRDVWDMFAKSVTLPFASKLETEETFVKIPSETIHILPSLFAQTANTKRNHRAVHLPSLNSGRHYDLEKSRILLKFINQSLVQKVMASLGDNGLKRRKDSTDSELSKVRQPSRNGTQLSMGILPGKLHSKAVDLDEGLKACAEFRVVTAAFVKIHQNYNERVSQLAISGFLNSLKTYEGVFQQYSVDDKGQTMMAIFGLPPLSHKNEPEYAVPAMIDFINFALRNSIAPLSIGLATGELLFSILGNAYRSEVGLL